MKAARSFGALLRLQRLAQFAMPLVLAMSPLAALGQAAPPVTVSPPLLDFGNVVVGDQSATKSSTVSFAVALYQISTFASDATCATPVPLCGSGPFICTTTCLVGTPMSGPGSCVISATFAPATTGLQSATYYICDNTVRLGASSSITFSGNGVPPPAASLSPKSFDFGNVVPGGTSTSATFTITNPGPVFLSVGLPAVTGPFNILSTDCIEVIAPNSSCTVKVVFAPTVPGAAAGTLTVSVQTGTVTASLSGTGVPAAQGVLVLPAGPIDLGTLVVGGPSATKDVELRNTGNAPLSFNAISVSPPFTLVNGCPVTLAAGEACTLAIQLEPLSVGDFSGALTVNTTAPGGSGLVAVLARVQPIAEAIIRVTPAAIGFGDRMIGTPSPSERITISNEGGSEATLALSLPKLHFQLVATNCGPTLAAHTACFADVLFRPVAFGALGDQVTVSSDVLGSPYAVSLAGNGCRPYSIGASRRGSHENCLP